MRFTLLCLLPGPILIAVSLVLAVARLEQLAGAVFLAGALALGIGLKLLGDYWRARLRSRASHDGRAAARRRSLDRA